jgi:hypothetical protein
VSIEIRESVADVAATTGERPGSCAEELLIKEARRRHRRRVAIIGSAFLLVAAAVAAGISQSSSTRTRPARSTSSTVPRPHPTTLIPPRCTPDQLDATAAFNGAHSELGAIEISNTSAKVCSLSGRPQVDVLNVTGTNGTDSALETVEIPYSRAGWPRQLNAPVELSARGTSTAPQAVIELDWLWCGATPGPISFEIWFPKWSLPLTVPVQAVSPPGFLPAVPPGCPTTALFAVDVIRDFRTKALFPEL